MIEPCTTAKTALTILSKRLSWSASLMGSSERTLSHSSFPSLRKKKKVKSQMITCSGRVKTFCTTAVAWETNKPEVFCIPSNVTFFRSILKDSRWAELKSQRRANSMTQGLPCHSLTRRSEERRVGKEC